MVAIEDLVPLDIALRAVKKYIAAFLVPGESSDLDSLGVADIRYDDKTDTHAALQRAIRVKVPGFGLTKVGFARCVLNVVNDELTPEEASTIEANFRVLFTELGRMQRDAMREFTADKTGTKVKRLKNAFLLDHPQTATKAQVIMLLEEVAASLDNSADADHLRNEMVSIKRDHQLDGRPSDAIADYPAFRDALSRLAYKLLNEVQRKGTDN